MILHQEAFDEFKLSNFDVLPRQRCAASRNANLGNWQASSSFAKQLSAWVTNRHHKLASQEAFMMSFDLEPASFAASAAELELGGSVSLHYREQTRSLYGGESFRHQLPNLHCRSLVSQWELSSTRSPASTAWTACSLLHALTGVELQAPGSFPGTGSLTAKSIQKSTGSLWKSLVQLLPWPSLSKLSLTTQQLQRRKPQLQLLRAQL